jgi:hypothetical protein
MRRRTTVTSSLNEEGNNGHVVFKGDIYGSAGKKGDGEGGGVSPPALTPITPLAPAGCA